MRHALQSLALAAAVLLAGGPALAGQIASLAVSPTTVQKNQPVTVSVGHAGSKCGYMFSTGLGPPQGPKVLQGAGATIPVTYPQIGYFNVTVWGKVKGNNPKCAVNAVVQPVTVTVEGSSGGTTSLKPSQGTPALKQVEPDSKAMKAGPRIPLSDPRERNPVINSVLFTAGPVGGVGPAVLAPGGQLFVKGLAFGGNPGQIYLAVNPNDFPGYSSGKVQLQNLTWGASKVSGRIPTGMTGPIRRAQVRVFVVRGDGKSTGGFPREFEIPVETRILSRSEVQVVSCGDEAPSNSCDGGATASIHGGHGSPPAQAGGFGRDSFAVQLKEGWVFSRVSRFERDISGDDGDYVNSLVPSLPIGATTWVGGIDWHVTSDDSVEYQIDIEVVRAKGAH